MTGYSLSLVPMSWVYGRWDIENKKTLWGLGPFRFIIHYNLGKWGE